ncbi:sortilin-like [Ruditapes philippinarum]|uniref:sortilin-like n=1 Tax=Ruditapes philippinarum TaxID=129788 RepID=UPI00295AA423|nr:sortilin-like [Ruditapes philippinarum]
MANKEGKLTSKYFLFSFLTIVTVCSIVEGNIRQLSFHTSKSVVQFNANDLPVFVEQKIENDHKLYKRELTEDQDPVCLAQNSKFVKSLEGKTITRNLTFTNETKPAMALAWAGENDGVLIIVTTDSILGTTTESSVFRSEDYGVTLTNLTDKLGLKPGKYVIKKHNGVQRHPYNSKKIYLIGEGNYMYTSIDGGLNFAQNTLSFPFDGELVFNPFNEDYLIALNAKKNMFISKNNGNSWQQLEIKDKATHVEQAVDKVIWGVKLDEDVDGGSNPDTNETIYFTYGAQPMADSFLKQFIDFSFTTDYTLAKSTDGGATYIDILRNVVSFDRQGKFLYASQIKSKTDAYGWRHLLISTDGGTVFKEVQLPTIEPDRFFSVMDIEENMIFMHVDNKEDTGHGTLYTSANQGIVYSISLTRHLFPNYGEIHDFYKVKSMRGVYITSQMSDDDSIHTMITYDQGGKWQKIPRPVGVPCKDESKGCYLQIHGMYSLKRGINANLPISEKTATGLILVHAHVAESLQKTEPDVFISRDGGYTWNLSLPGAHHYQILDHGGLLVAVSKSDPSPKVLRFSLDEGRCWHDYKFTDQVLNFTGLVTEPEGKSAVVMLWGYVQETKKWVVNVVDFEKVIDRKCEDNDYEPWKAHSALRVKGIPEDQGCLLGIKETFLRLKKDSWCLNGYIHEQKSKREFCTCTREDYECDYGYFRPGSSDNCVKEPDFQGPEIDICMHGHDEKLVSEGYRKIPGDKCKNGFKPTSKIIDLNKVCDEYGNSIVQFDEQQEQVASQNGFGRGIKILAIIIVSAVLLLAATMGVYFVRKFILLRRHKTEYRYSLLNQGEQQNLMDDDDEEEENKAVSSTVRYEDSDDEELNTTVRPAKQNGVVKKTSKPKDTNPFGSYHDDSDDDMLS